MVEPGVIAPLERVKSGVGGLDVVLQGGFLRGGLYIIQGAPGTGKTTLGNQICFNHVAGSGRAVYVTLLAEYHARMMQHLSTMSFFNASKIPKDISYINGFSTMHELGLKGLVSLLRREVISRRCTILVIDGIVSARRAADDEQAFNAFVHELQAVAIATACTVFLLTSAKTKAIAPEQTMVDGIIELANQLTGWSATNSLQVVKFRGSGFLSGRHTYRITDSGFVVHPRIEALLARPSQVDTSSGEKVSSGHDRLDKMLGGGLPGASTTMVMGPTGTGKTTMGLGFLAGSSRAEPGLLFTFYETPRRIDAKINGVCPALRDLVDDGTVEVVWQPPTDGLLDMYGERLLDAVRRRNVKRLFIDGLGAFQHAELASGTGRIRLFLAALMNEMRVLGVTTLYSMEVPDVSGPDIRTNIGDLSNLAENLILLRFVEEGAMLRRLISIVKVRDSEFDEYLHEFKTTSTGLVIDPQPDRAQYSPLRLARRGMIKNARKRMRAGRGV